MIGLLRSFLILLVLLVIVVLAGGFGSLRERGESLLDAGRDGAQGQGAAQISRLEFVQARYGMTKERLRALVGEAEATTSAAVEGLALECWYYGIAGTTGSYQFCFSGGRLQSKWRFGR